MTASTTNANANAPHPSSALRFSSDEATAEFLQRLGTHCLERWGAYERELDALWAKVRKYRDQFEGDFSRRRREGSEKDATQADRESVFARSNYSLNIPRGMIRNLLARSEDSIFGSDPWLSLDGIGGAGDEDEATDQDMEAFFESKLSDPASGFLDARQDAVLDAITCGYAVAKAIWRRDTKPSERVIHVAVGPDGEPLTLPGGRMVRAEDGPPQWNDAEQTYGWPDLDPSLSLRLGSLDDYRLEPYAESSEEVLYEGAAVAWVDSLDFVWDIRAPDLERSPFVATTADLTRAEIYDMYRGGRIDEETYAHVRTIGQASRASGEGGPGSGAREPRTDAEDSAGIASGACGDDHVTVMECYLDYEVPADDYAPGDDAPRPISRLYVLLAKESGRVLLADYLTNVTPGGRLPFVMIAPWRRPGRCYGPGIYEQYDSEATFVDATLNGLNYRNEYAVNPVKAVSPNAFKNQRGAETLKCAPGEIWEKAQDVPLSELFEFVSLFPYEADTKYLLEIAIQQMSLDSGVSPASQGDIGAMPQVETAQGVRAVLSHGAVQTRPAIRKIAQGLEELVEMAAAMQFARMDYGELARYLGHAGADADDYARRVRARLGASWRAHARLRLTRFKEDEDRQRFAAVEILLQRYMTYAPGYQRVVRPLYVERLKDLGIEAAEDYLPVVEETAPMPAGLLPEASPAPMEKTTSIPENDR